jgi:hypothetical protein
MKHLYRPFVNPNPPCTWLSVTRQAPDSATGAWLGAVALELPLPARVARYLWLALSTLRLFGRIHCFAFHGSHSGSSLVFKVGKS